LILIIFKAILGINVASESFFYKKGNLGVDVAVDNVTNKFLRECRSKIPNKDKVKVIIDAGWSHPGWWARECTVIAVDGNTGLPLSIFHVLKDVNFTGSSKGFVLFYLIKL
jgi:hypothetical protein